MEIRTISEELKKEYGQKIYKLSLSSGCSCPNRDGKIGFGGCSFCSEGGSGDFASPFLPIDEQIRLARARVDRKIPANIPKNKRRYIAYFQSFTNTYGDPKRLKGLYLETINRPEIVIPSIGTRPDCLTDEILQMLIELSEIKPVWVELGLQTIHEKTAQRIHRGYPLPVFEDAMQKLKAAGLTVIVHVIMGLPGETHEDMYETIRYLSNLEPRPDGIKRQLLHALRGTKLADEYQADPFHSMTLEEYAEVLVHSLQILPPEIVIHRLTGDGPKNLLLEPKWSVNKKKVLNTLHQAIREAKR